jgi:hypothetical protein
LRRVYETRSNRAEVATVAMMASGAAGRRKIAATGKIDRNRQKRRALAISAPRMRMEKIKDPLHRHRLIMGA